MTTELTHFGGLRRNLVHYLARKFDIDVHKFWTHGEAIH